MKLTNFQRKDEKSGGIWIDGFPAVLGRKFRLTPFIQGRKTKYAPSKFYRHGAFMSRPWYPFYWSDYTGKTYNLTMSQHGAYMLFLRWTYTEGGKPVPHKERYSIARATSEQERLDADYVLNRYYVREGDSWQNLRAIEVIESSNNAHEKRVNAGKKGGEAKSSNATAMLEKSPSTHNQTHNHNQDSLPPQSPPPVKDGDNFKNGSGFFDGNGKGLGVRAGISLKQATLQKAKEILPRADIYALEQQWKSSAKEMPNNPDGAFIGWCKTFAKNHPELKD